MFAQKIPCSTGQIIIPSIGGAERFVASKNATAARRNTADFICNGENDGDMIKAAATDYSGIIELSEGTFDATPYGKDLEIQLYSQLRGQGLANTHIKFTNQQGMIINAAQFAIVKDIDINAEDAIGLQVNNPVYFKIENASIIGFLAGLSLSNEALSVININNCYISCISEYNSALEILSNISATISNSLISVLKIYPHSVVGTKSAILNNCQIDKLIIVNSAEYVNNGSLIGDIEEVTEGEG